VELVKAAAEVCPCCLRPLPKVKKPPIVHWAYHAAHYVRAACGARTARPALVERPEDVTCKSCLKSVKGWL
jgi:hypothetical protein